MHAAFLRSELPYAEPTWLGVKSRIDGYVRGWRGEATAACRGTHIAHTQSAQQLDKRMLCLDRGRRQLAALAAELATGARDAIEHAVEAAGALPDLAACGRTENLMFGLAPPPASLSADVTAMRDRLARARTQELVGRYDEALAIAREASATTDRLGYPPVHAEALVQVARALGSRGTSEASDEATRLYFQALTVAEAERHDLLVIEIWRRLVALAIRMDSSMARAHEWWGHASAWARRSAATMSRLDDDDGADGESELHFMLGEIYYRESDYARSADEERRAIAGLPRTPAHALELSRYSGALALSLERLDALGEAIRLHESALAIATETLGAGHPNVITLEINYGRALLRSGHADRARAVLEAALASMPRRDRDSHSNAAVLHAIMSDVECARGDLDSAVEHGQASLQIYERTLAPGHVRLADAYMNLANVEFKRRDFRRALVLYQDALSLKRGHLGGEHYHVGVNEVSIAETLANLERPDEAMSHLTEAERVLKRASGRERDVEAWMLTVRGEILVGQRRFAAAVPPLEQALALFGDAAADPTNHALALWTLARALREVRRSDDRVRTLAERAHAIFNSLGAVGAYDRDAVAHFLDGIPHESRPSDGMPTK
ncbi:MAG TPA: tetratricopeptide repeat protein [Kofleriaceae bacterium]|nr:tetratricopeptide repeat protein [Kofleriaceae bacterium]